MFDIVEPEKVSSLTDRFIDSFKDNSLETQIRSKHGQKVIANNQLVFDKITEFLNTFEAQKNQLSEEIKFGQLKEYLTQDEYRLLNNKKTKKEEMPQSLSFCRYLSIVEEPNKFYYLENPKKDKKLDDLQKKINMLYEQQYVEIKEEPAIQEKEEIPVQQAAKVDSLSKEEIFQKFSFSNVDNLQKNMYIFDDKVKQDKDEKSAKTNNNMQSCLSNKNIGGGLDMLFSSMMPAEEKKQEQPEELKMHIEKQSSRIPDDVVEEDVGYCDDGYEYYE